MPMLSELINCLLLPPGILVTGCSLSMLLKSFQAQVMQEGICFVYYVSNVELLALYAHLYLKHVSTIPTMFYFTCIVIVG